MEISTSNAVQPIRLDSMQRDALTPCLRAFADAAPDAESRARYAALEEAAGNLEVSPEMLPALGAILEVALQSGRVRRNNGPAAETSLAALYQKTPRGAEIAETLKTLNAALSKLKGATVENISAASRIPGNWTLTIKTESVQLVIHLGANGAGVDSLEVAV